ncbi:MAG: hypothetical protein AAGI37_09220 [Planctomycetota bacterium]
MAMFFVDEVIDENAGDGDAIWDRLRQYVIKQSVELIRRYDSGIGGYVIEVCRWKSVRDATPGSNRVDASPEIDY